MGAVALVAVMRSRAAAEPPLGTNALGGPVLGLRLGGPRGSRLIAGVEVGAGLGPERVNVGITRRRSKKFVYAALDPWLWLGGSLGVGVDSDGEPHGVIGVWEGGPLIYPSCTQYNAQGGRHQQAPDLPRPLTTSLC